MKALISFSLNRRLNNPVSWMLYGFSFFLFGVILFIDVLLTSFAPTLILPKSIHMNPSMFDMIGEYLPSNFIYQNDPSKADVFIHVKDDGYLVTGNLSMEQGQVIEHLIVGYHRITMIENMPDSLVSLFDQVMIAHIEWENVSESSASHSGFIVITTIYFMLLSFSTAVANEVVNEKTSNVIEVILTSVSHKEHYYSKLLIGWFTMLMQLMIHGFGFVFWLMVRIVFDNGSGLLNALYRWQFLTIHYSSIEEWIRSLDLQLSSISIVVLCTIFLMLGILLVQLLMVLISVHINSIEEAAAIQGPFYLGMLVIYYLAIFINSADQLNHGWGYIFSYTPILSMLFMPSRLLLTNVMFSELILALAIAFMALIICLVLGEEHYRNNLLKGSAKSAFVKNET
ncbi:MAG: ABC transporter permease [Erysipelotrichaceae bacterium]|nr:ABC transporter permease [Erysipelotrichaceae bacterium]